MEEITCYSCRVCFTKCKRTDMKVQKVADLFYQSIGFRISPYDTPQRICLRCLKSLRKVHKFKLACIKAEEILKGHGIKQEPKIEIESFIQANSYENVSEVKNGQQDEIFQERNLFDTEGLKTVIRECGREPTIDEDFVLNYLNKPETRPKVVNIDPVQYEMSLSTQLIETNTCPKFKCCCDAKFPSLDHLRGHNMTQNCTKLPLIHSLRCDFCTFSCALEINMRHHNVSMHFNEKHFRCDCGEEIFCTDSRLEHVIFKCKNRTETLQIPFKRFILNPGPEMTSMINVGLRSMKKFPNPKSKNKNRCPPARVVCEQCGKEVLKCRLTDHIEAKHNAKRFECDLCQSSYVDKSNLSRHMFYKHLKQRQYPCPYCDKIYEQSGSRSLHIKKLHTNDLKHVCNVCGKRFVKPSKLKYHLATHSDIRNVPCPQCDSMFRSIKDLMGHRSAVHSNRIYTCQVCNENFRNSRLLKVHRKIHE